MEIIDTHVHFWDLHHPTITYPWLAPGALHPILGDVEGIKSLRYDPSSYWAECRFSGVTKAVHVEAAARAEDPLAEVKWVLDLPPHETLSLVIVADAVLDAPDVEARVDALASIAEVRGVRDFELAEYFRSPERHRAFERGVVRLERSGLLLDLDCAWEEMRAARRLAEEHGDLRVVLEHIGYPHRRDDGYFADWRPAILDIATAGNVYCKLSGLGMTDRAFTAESLQRWVETCLEAFGPSRCMFGSNWPLDRIASSYDALIDVFVELISTCSSTEQRAICSGTARQLYGL